MFDREEPLEISREGPTFDVLPSLVQTNISST